MKRGPVKMTEQQWASRTPWQIAMARLRRHRMAIFGFRVLVVLYATAVFAGFISPYGYDNEVRAFADCVRTGQPPVGGTGEQGRLALATSLAARRSIETGQVVPF